MLHIVLYEPQIPQNTGNVARTCAVADIRLHLIEPLGFQTDSKRLRRAGLTYWDSLSPEIYASWEAFLARQPEGRKLALSSKGQTPHSAMTFEDGDFLIFGREDAGLPEDVTATCHGMLRIPMRPVEGARCLNLATSCGIVAYEALRQLEYPNLR